jgi:hypothetical protein
VRLADEHERRAAERVQDGVVERYLPKAVALDGSPEGV